MEDRKGRIPPIATAFLVLVLMTPRMVTAGEFPFPTLTQEELEEFFEDNVEDLVNYLRDHLPSQGQQGTGGGQRRRQVPATNARGMYMYSYQVGTPPQSVTGALDISSELVTKQCDLCDTCTSTRSSITMALVACTSSACQNFGNFAATSCSADVSRPRCGYIYGGAVGYLATESFTFGATHVDDLVFGCGSDSVIGLGRRGPLSSQLGGFSYYFAPNGGDSSSGDTQSFIHFGENAKPQTNRASTTRLVDSGGYYPNYYLVGLTGIQVDGYDLPIPRGTFDLRKDGSGGVVLSIAVPVTSLEGRAYKLLTQALMTRIGLPTVRSRLGLDVCYDSQSLARVKIPAMALVFDGNAVMELQVRNYFYLDASSGVECLTIMPSSDVSLLGSLIQAGTHMIYDIRYSTLTFESLQPTFEPLQPAPLNRRSPAPSPHTMPLMVLFAHFLWVAVYMIL